MAKVVGVDFAGPIDSLVQFGNARVIHIKADHGNAAPRERYGDRQYDITQSDDRNFTLVCHYVRL